MMTGTHNNSGWLVAAGKTNNDIAQNTTFRLVRRAHVGPRPAGSSVVLERDAKRTTDSWRPRPQTGARPSLRSRIRRSTRAQPRLRLNPLLALVSLTPNSEACSPRNPPSRRRERSPAANPSALAPRRWSCSSRDWPVRARVKARPQLASPSERQDCTCRSMVQDNVPGGPPSLYLPRVSGWSGAASVFS